MANFFAFYPSSTSAANPSIGLNGQSAPLSSTEVGGVGPDGNLHPITTDNSGNQNVNVISSTLPSGSATSANQVIEITALQAIQASDASIDGKTPALVSGRVPVDGSGVTQPISAASLPLPSGASTSALQTSGNTSLSSIDGKTPALGQALSAASVPVVLPASQVTALTPPTTVTVIQPTGTNLHAVIDSGSVSVSNFPATQPVSGTVTANQGTAGASAWKVDGSAVTQPISAASLPLPSGAATSAIQTTISGQLPTTLGAKTSAASLSVTLATDQASVPVKPTTGTLTDGSGSTSATPSTSTQIFATNSTRKYLLIQNLSTTATIYVNFTSAASAAAGSYALAPLGSIVQESGFISTEAVTVLAVSASVPFTAKQA